jgi:hypothetical protein
MFKRLIKNKKGTAEVIGSVMFIVILMFFFTNVYLWHDAAVKEMNDLYAAKLNSQISINYDPATNILSVKNLGGVDATVECYWIDHAMTEIPETASDDQKVVHAGGGPLEIHLTNDPAEFVKVVTTTGNIAIDSDFTN